MAQLSSVVRLSKAQVKPICVLSVSLGNLYCMQMNFDVQVVIHLHEICGSYAMKLQTQEIRLPVWCHLQPFWHSHFPAASFNEELAFIFFKKIGF